MPLAKLQNKCLYKTTGAYKRTPQAILKYKAVVLLLILFLFFISKLLEIFDDSQDTIALEFINNTNLII